MIVPGIAVKRLNATNINLLMVHAINTQNEHPLCTNSLFALTFEPNTKATIENVNCRKCIKKLNPVAINPYKPVIIERIK